MSYCRFSSSNWRSDVYVYENCNGGWTTHVAGRRRWCGPIPDLMWSDLSMALHRWAGGVWCRQTNTTTYPQAWKGRVYGLWLALSCFWHAKIHMGSLNLIPLRPIGLPHDGDQFNHDTPGECADWLLELRALGYFVPQYAIDALQAEAAQGEVEP